VTGTWQADVSNGPDQLLNYGGVGLLAFLLLGGVVALWRRDVRTRDAELLRANQRGDRLEAELAQLNRTVQEQTMHALNDATRAVADAMARMRGTG
jgi:hypothetical protein